MLNKIQHIEKTWREARAWSNTETGTGMEESDPGQFLDVVQKKCPYYMDLLDIMADRASTEPRVTNYEPEPEPGSDDDNSLSETSNASKESRRTTATNSSKKLT